MEEKKLEKNIDDQLLLSQTLFNCAKILMNWENELTDAVLIVFDVLGKYYQADRVHLYELDLKNHTVSNTIEWCSEGVEPEMPNLQNLDLNTYHRWMTCFSENKVFIMRKPEDIIELYPNEYRLMTSQKVTSMLAIPCIHKNTFTGFLTLDNPRLRDFQTEPASSVSYFVVNELYKHRLRQELEHSSYYDDLSGVLNRRRYTMYLSSYEQNSHFTLGIGSVDINGLKKINTNYGQNYGDAFIKKTADHIRSIFSDTPVFRLNADAFLIIYPDIPFESFKKQVDLLKQTFAKEESFSAAIGFSWADQNPEIKKLICGAEDSMFLEKQKYYEKRPSETGFQKMNALTSLLSALRQNQFLIYLQPKFNIKSWKICGAEALIRGFNPDTGEIVGPGMFIEILEREKIIKYIDLFVFEEVCKLLQKWKKQGKPLLNISLNFSRLTLMESELIPQLTEIINRYDCDIRRIDIEITESLGDIEVQHMSYVINQLKSIGLQISLDDFGSKYTNTSVLSAFDFETLKLDKSLIDTICTNQKSKLIVKSIIGLCKQLHVQVVAEGVEDEYQLNLLVDFSCDQIQGFYFSKPLPVDAFELKFLL